MKDNNEYPEKGVKTENKICGQTCGCLSEYDCHISKEDFVKRQLENNIPEGYKDSTLETLKYMFELGFENGVNFQNLQPANNDYAVKESQWKPISEAPKDGTGIEVYWFAAYSFYFVQWDDKALVWSNVYYDKDILGHITKAVWRPIIRPEYKDYHHLFITPNN